MQFTAGDRLRHPGRAGEAEWQALQRPLCQIGKGPSLHHISGPANKEDSLSDQGDNPQRSTAARFAFWKGADQPPADARTMASLNSNAGQSGMSDGSAMQSNDAALQQNTRMHHQELGGNFRGSPSGFLDTPND